MVNQILLVSVTSFFMFANTSLHVKSQHHSANTHLYVMSQCHVDINCSSLRFTALKIWISENRPCRIHRSPTDTNKWYPFLYDDANASADVHCE